MPQELFYCEKCKKTMIATEFYGSNDAEKYPDGKLRQCKKCITMHVDNYDADTYTWILKECDVPYVPDVWDDILMKQSQSNKAMTGMTILGRYLSKMKLKQWKDYRWKDNEHIQELKNKRIKETMERQGYSVAEIDQAIQTAIMPTVVAPPPIDEPENAQQQDFPQEDYFAMQSGGEDDFIDELTEEDKTYLRLKWGKTYRPEEWIRLEQLYEEMMASYDIQSAGHIDTLKLICKTSLKSNQLLDIGDVEGAQKMIRMYNDLMKSGKFTAQQNDAIAGDFVDSIGELIELCEKQGYIERYYIEQPNDKVDLTIADMQKYTRTLIQEETNLPIMVEKALRDIEKEDIESAQNNEDSIVDDLEMSLEDLERTLQDKDFEEFDDFIEDQMAIDASFLEGDEA